MKCPRCGSENTETNSSCESCGCGLNNTGGRSASGNQSSSDQEETQKYVNHRDVARKWRFDYAVTTRDETSRGLDAVCSLLSELENPEITVRAFLDRCAQLISKQFGIKEVTIGLKSHGDGLFRYESIVGAGEIAEKALRGIQYSEEDFRLNGRYRGTSLSKYSTIFLTEDNPYTNGEEVTYSHPVLLKSERRSATESVEGDYIDIHIFGRDEELIGWIELSSTKAGNLPDVRTIKWMEAVSRIIGFALTRVKFREAR